MSLTVTGYNNLEIVPYELSNLLELRITKKINEHARLHLTGIVPEQLKDSYVEMTKAETPIQVSQVDATGKSTPIFNGIVLTIEVKAVRGIYYIEVEAVSHSYKLDIKRKSRSFQNKGLAYSSLLKQVASDYPGLDAIDEASKGATIGKFTMQYLETDWQFLKRMASRLHTGLIPASAFDKPKFFFGVPEGSSKGKLEDFHYTVRKKLSDYRQLTQNSGPSVQENDFIYYEVETDRVLDLGDKVEIKGKSLYVSEAYTEMKNSLLKHRYILCAKDGMSQKTVYNESISGVSIQGKVIGLANDTVKVHLEIDEKQNPGEACFFPYSSVYTAEGNSGWYVMPEMNDHVRIYFPGNKEEDGIAMSSVRKDSSEGKTNKVNNPDVKVFRTANGKELMFGPNEIMLTAKDGEIFIKMNEKDGIQIYSTKPIKFISKEDIMIDSEKKVIISAKEQISLSCKQSSIKMDGSTVINGKEVKTN
ncbi:contractile injection system protein, VgrG/Pvc8 family [Brevibacillus dissolubilis]|uniref:contractile injection system protein, VgrG/Pvc8 family n=1 Tax=Brevibacillus dissolubilis TaxID=1844116 RepID=UPI00111767E0|nr:contractile injection system protein, VgrG/Pvc8 family [Brevibacillus dissolubilis]